jgi:hypothetical protein
MARLGSPVFAATWENCQADFAFDGYQHLLLPNTSSPHDWERFWSAVRTGPFEVEAYREQVPIALPKTAAWFFAEQQNADVHTAVYAPPVAAQCHFIGGDVVLDIDPRQVGDGGAFEAVLDIMRYLAMALSLPVVANAERCPPETAFLAVESDGRAVFLPGGSIRRGQFGL